MPVNYGRAGCKRAVDVAVGAEAEASEGCIHRRLFDLRQYSVETAKQERDCLLRIAFFCVEQCGADCHNIGGQIVELLATLTGDAARRHIEVAREVERHRAVQDAAHGVMTIGSPDPLEHLIDGIGIGEDVMCGFPIAVLIGISKTNNPECCRVSE